MTPFPLWKVYCIPFSPKPPSHLNLRWSGPTVFPVRGPQGAPLCTLIFKLLNFQDRDLVLPEPRNVGELKFENTKLLIFLDYSIETQ